MKHKKKAKHKARQNTAIFLLLVVSFLLCLIISILPDRDDSSSFGCMAVDESSEYNETRAAGQDMNGKDKNRKNITGHTGVDNMVMPSHVTASHKRREGPVSCAKISIVIDDVGYNLKDLDAFLEFPGQLTFAVLPNLPYSRQAARRIKEAGKEVILHMPMEPLGKLDPGPGAVYTFHNEEEIRVLLDNAFASVPEAQGFNNHMGSKVMSDIRVMNIVMNYAREKGKYFLDSKTYSDSIAFKTAGAYDIPFLERSIFLDNDLDKAKIKNQFLKGMEIAGKHGSAILIGHVQNPQVLTVLKEFLPLLQKENGSKTVGLSELLVEE